MELIYIAGFILLLLVFVGIVFIYLFFNIKEDADILIEPYIPLKIKVRKKFVDDLDKIVFYAFKKYRLLEDNYEYLVNKTDLLKRKIIACKVVRKKMVPSLQKELDDDLNKLEEIKLEMKENTLKSILELNGENITIFKDNSNNKGRNAYHKFFCTKIFSLNRVNKNGKVILLNDKIFVETKDCIQTLTYCDIKWSYDYEIVKNYDKSVPYDFIKSGWEHERKDGQRDRRYKYNRIIHYFKKAFVCIEKLDIKLCVDNLRKYDEFGSKLIEIARNVKEKRNTFVMKKQISMDEINNVIGIIDSDGCSKD